MKTITPVAIAIERDAMPELLELMQTPEAPQMPWCA
jgi:hypothetical protein